MNTFKFYLAQYLPLGKFREASLGLLCAISLSLCAPRVALSQNPVQRDQQALTILAQTIAAGGGQQLMASIQDLTETGTVTYNSSEQLTGNITVKSRGFHQLRIDADLPKGTRTTVANGNGGSLKDENGWIRPINRQTATGLGGLTLPYLPLIAAIQDSSTSIVYSGIVTHNGVPAYDIRLEKVHTEQQNPGVKRGAYEARDFYIDPNTSLVAAISDPIHTGSQSDKGIAHGVVYSNYQSENGVMIPLTIAETVRDVTTFTMQISQVTFNSGLSDSEFER